MLVEFGVERLQFLRHALSEVEGRGLIRLVFQVFQLGCEASYRSTYNASSFLRRCECRHGLAMERSRAMKGGSRLEVRLHVVQPTVEKERVTSEDRERTSRQGVVLDVSGSKDQKNVEFSPI